MYLTGPQSKHYREQEFEGAPATANHFDWELFYRYKDAREQFWIRRIGEDALFRSLVERHFSDFKDSIDRTVDLVAPVNAPSVLDVGLSSEQLDKALIDRAGADLTILDVQAEAEGTYRTLFADRGRFVLGDVVSYAASTSRREQYDLVYSAGLIEHFPDKSDILDAHVRLVRPGGIVLIYVPIDSEENRRITALAAEWENFGYRELMTPAELSDVCRVPELEIVASAQVGFFAAVWARKAEP